MCGECIAHLRPPPPWRPQVPAPQPLTAWARNPGAGDQRRLGMGASICLGPPPRGFQGPSLPPLAPPPSGCPGEVSGRGYPTLVSDPQRGRNWCCHRPGPSQHKGIRAPCPVRKAPPPPVSPTKAATLKLARIQGTGCPARLLAPTEERRPHLHPPVGIGTSPWCAGKGLSVLLASQNELLGPRRVDSVLPPLCWEELSARHGEEAALNCRTLGQIWEREPWNGSSGVRNTAATGRCRARLRDGGEGGPALCTHLHICNSLLSWLGCRLWLERGPRTSAGTKGHCDFFFFP